MSATVKMNEITEFLPEITAIRRDLHAHPELGFHEERTSTLAAKELRKLGIEVAEKIGGTGVVETIRGSVAGTHSIGLRADMDALPIQEITGCPMPPQQMGECIPAGTMGIPPCYWAARHLSKHKEFAGTLP
jgi:metal-dependent amidase/aminoacylase/carboxypeptidase family protein